MSSTTRDSDIDRQSAASAHNDLTATGPRYPGIPITTNGNQLVAYYTEARVVEAGIFYPITPSTEMGENFQLSFAQGELNVFGDSKIAIETEGEHAAQAGAITASVAFRSKVWSEVKKKFLTSCWVSVLPP